MRNTLLVLLFVTAPAFAADFPDWMAGSWKNPGTEEHWTTPGGGLMVGMNRSINSKGKGTFEFLRIEQRDGKLAYVAMPGGRPATIFPLKSLTDARVVFENPTHDFPQRVIYWKDGARLCARVEGTMQGKVEGEEWCWSRF
jgi:hypothetical protein